METHCYICGVVGFEELIATCIKCKSLFIHVYCMKTVQFIIPDDWVCEDCHEPPKQVASQSTDEVLVLKRAVKFIPTDEAITLASQPSLSKGKRHLASPEKACKAVEIPKKRVENPTNMVPLATLRTRCDVCISSTEKSSGLPSAEQNRCKNNSVHAHPLSAVPEPSSKQMSCIKNPVHAHTPLPFSKLSPEMQSFKELFIPERTISTKSRRGFSQGGDPCNNTLKVSKKEREERWSDGQLTMDRYLPNHPASHATWKGSFRTSGFAAPVRSCDTVWGYPPARVGSKAYEFSKKMPDVLHFEAIPRCSVWANMFNDGGPDKNDIGLYFLPIGDRSEQRYSCLVSHLEKQDIVLKSCICGIELLIFSSSYLDENSKKINQAYYLWGLFVLPVITLTEPNQNQHILKNEQAEEMEIDMLGGAPVGKIDVPVPRDSLLSCSKMSKEAVAASQPASKAQVKPEKWDGDELASPPGFPAFVAGVEPRVPPGFERVKYKTIAEILQSGDGRWK